MVTFYDSSRFSSNCAKAVLTKRFVKKRCDLDIEMGDAYKSGGEPRGMFREI